MSNRRNRIQEYLKLDCPFVGIPDDTVTSEELNQLSSQARWLYMVLLTKFDRRKNKIKQYYSFLYTDLTKITGYDNRRLAYCIKELEAADFIDVVHGGKNNPSQYLPNVRWLM